MPNFKTNAIRNCLRSHEKAERLPDDHPRRLALTEAIPRRSNRQSWYSRAKSITKYFNIPSCLSKRQPIRRYTRDPWNQPNNFSVFNTLEGISNNHTSFSHYLNQAASAQRISSLAPDIVIYIDGSASAGISKGGSGVVIANNDPHNPSYTTCCTLFGCLLDTNSVLFSYFGHFL